MDWRRSPQGDPGDPDGITSLLNAAHAEIGGPPLTGTRFLHAAREMLRFTRQIEAAVLGVGTTLYVGFQDARKFDKERTVYRDLTGAGTHVVAYGAGEPEDDCGATWVALPDEPDALENQWFLITRAPEPIAFVGFETSPDPLRTHGPAGRRGKTWEGFVSGDKRLVDALIDHLDGVAALHAA